MRLSPLRAALVSFALLAPFGSVAYAQPASPAPAAQTPAAPAPASPADPEPNNFKPGKSAPAAPGAAPAAPSTSPDVEHIRIVGLRPRFVLHFSDLIMVVCSCDVTSANRRSNRTACRPQATRRSGSRNHHDAAMAVRLSEVDASGDALSAPITVNNNGIDARNGQAYHGRKTTTTNGTRPALARSRTSEERRAKRQRRRRLTSRVRPCSGAAGRA